MVPAKRDVGSSFTACTNHKAHFQGLIRCRAVEEDLRVMGSGKADPARILHGNSFTAPADDAALPHDDERAAP